MGDGLKLSKDKRHRSSSSLAGVSLEGTRSERKLDKNASIPELDDQFSMAEVRCDDLQEKIDLIKTLKRKKKLKKRSTTRITDPPKTPETVPFITVRTQPKKTTKKMRCRTCTTSTARVKTVPEVSQQQAARLRRLEIPPNPTRGYLDPATVEQHRMIGQVRGYNHSFKHPHQERIGNFQSSADNRPYVKLKRQRSQADGDSMCSQSIQPSEGLEVACGQEENGDEFIDVYNRPAEYSPAVSGKKSPEGRQVKQTTNRRRHVPRDVPTKEERVADHWRGPQGETPAPPRRHSPNKILRASASQQMEERPVVELFNKHKTIPESMQLQGTAPMIPTPMNPVLPVPVEKKLKKGRNIQKLDDDCHDPLETIHIPMEPKHVESTLHPRRVRYRSRRYEMPTVASQMKQAGMRNYYDTSNHTNIPFVVSKSTAPSHNIGVNLQQVLNGLKIQQPLSGIPLTIAHHMGLGYVPKYGSKSTIVNQQPSLDHYSEINAIRVGQRLVRLPSYKYISYNRLLNLYREGDGMVPRFLRAIDRPHYFYTSMYNLATNREEFDCATSKGRCGSHEAKQSLAEYASLYREYEHIDKCIREGNCEPELELRKEDLTKELAAREEHIRKVVQEYRTGGESDQPIRASASTAEDGYRHSTYKLGDNQ